MFIELTDVFTGKLRLVDPRKIDVIADVPDGLSERKPARTLVYSSNKVLSVKEGAAEIQGMIVSLEAKAKESDAPLALPAELTRNERIWQLLVRHGSSLTYSQCADIVDEFLQKTPEKQYRPFASAVAERLKNGSVTATVKIKNFELWDQWALPETGVRQAERYIKLNMALFRKMASYDVIESYKVVPKLAWDKVACLSFSGRVVKINPGVRYLTAYGICPDIGYWVVASADEFVLMPDADVEEIP